MSDFENPKNQYLAFRVLPKLNQLWPKKRPFATKVAVLVHETKMLQNQLILQISHCLNYARLGLTEQPFNGKQQERQNES